MACRRRTELQRVIDSLQRRGFVIGGAENPICVIKDRNQRSAERKFKRIFAKELAEGSFGNLNDIEIELTWIYIDIVQSKGFIVTEDECEIICVIQATTMQAARREFKRLYNADIEEGRFMPLRERLTFIPTTIY